MAAKKRASSRSKLLNRAVKAGRSYLRQAERRLPPDVRKQIERSIKDGQKTVEGAISQLRARVDRTARQVDLERALKSLDGLSKQVQQLARAAASSGGAAATPARRRARRPATRKAPARKAAAASATSARAPRKAATSRQAAPRRRAAANPVAPPPAVESPSMAIPDPSPREPAG